MDKYVILSKFFTNNINEPTFYQMFQVYKQQYQNKTRNRQKI